MERMRRSGVGLILGIAACGGIVEDDASAPSPKPGDALEEPAHGCPGPSAILPLGEGKEVVASTSGCVVAITSKDGRTLRILDHEGKLRETVTETGPIKFLEVRTFASE